MKLDKRGDFIGREALLRARGQPLRKKLLTFVLDDPAAYAWGGEAMPIDGEPVGELSFGRLEPAGRRLRRPGLRARRGGAARRTRGTPVAIDLWGEPVAATAWDRWPPKAPGRG